MLVSIIITTKNKKRFLERSLPSIFKQTVEDFEVIIVDSGSTDGTLEFVSGFKTKIIKISPQNFNRAHAFNEGAKKAKGEILVRLSDDVIPGTPGWLSYLLKDFKNSKVGVVFGKPRPYPEDHFWDRIFLNIVIKLIFGDKRRIFTKGTKVAGGNSAFRRSLWQKFPFDESLPRAEDTLFVGQIHQGGWLSIYEPKAWVYHNHGFLRPLLKDIRENIPVFFLIKKKLYNHNNATA